MGCTSSSPEVKEHKRRVSRTQTRVIQALMKQKKAHDQDEHPMTFERLLLKFEKKMHLAVQDVKKNFDEFAVEGQLNVQNLSKAIRKIFADLTDEEIRDIFEVSDIDDSKAIEVKEYLVALTLAVAFDKLPVVDDGTGHQKALMEMLNLILSAYILFDVKCEGFIRKKNVDALMDEHRKGAKGKNGMLSEQRWKEMDWDANGCVDFQEFVFAFTSWVNVDDDLEDTTV